MAFVKFEMERYQSTYENEVAFNLSESGVEPLSLGELLQLGGVEREQLDSLHIGYFQSNGELELRQRIAALYPGADADNVLVTTGGAEANFLNAWALLSPSDEVLFQTPNYMQLAGLARCFGGELLEWPLVEERGWQPDPDRLADLVGPKTRLIVLTNPNNPTGAVLDEAVVDAVVTAAARVGAWVLCDEIYRGAELGPADGPETPSLWGRYDRLVVTSGLSKAYGLPGLRVGWVVGPAEHVARLWAHKDYTTISVSALSQRLARWALEPAVRGRLLARTRRTICENWALLEAWLRERDEVFSWIPPQAGAIVTVRYDLPLDSWSLAERLRTEGDCLIVPGRQLGLPSHLRLGFGPEPETLKAGLERLATLVDAVRAPS